MTMKERITVHDEIEASNKRKLNEWKRGRITMKKAILLRTNGTIDMVDYPEENVMDWFYQNIGCELVECVRPRGLPEGVVMVVDEEGLLVDEPKLNIIPSYLYGFLDHGQPICGDVLIVREELGDDGYDFEGMDEEEASSWLTKFRNIQPLAEVLIDLTIRKTFV